MMLMLMLIQVALTQVFGATASKDGLDAFGGTGGGVCIDATSSADVSDADFGMGSIDGVADAGVSDIGSGGVDFDSGSGYLAEFGGSGVDYGTDVSAGANGS